MGFPLHVAQEEWKWNEIAPCWIGAHACLALKRSAEEVARANEFFREAPIDWKFDPDMRFCELLHSYFAFRDDPALSREARERLLALFSEHRGPRRAPQDPRQYGTTENHALMGYVWRLLCAQILGDEREFSAAAEALGAFFDDHARRGWDEFASPCYMEKDVGALLLVRQWCRDELLRRKAEMLLDALFAEYAALSLEQMYCGPAARVYGREYRPAEANHNSRRNKACHGAYSCGYLLFGMGRPAYYGVLGVNILATSDYRPPEVVVDLACDRVGRGTYEFRSRKHGGARIYCYCTPEYILGSSVELPGIAGMRGRDALTNSLVLRGSTRKVFFTETLPGARVFQYRNVLVGAGGANEAYFPLNELNEVLEREGWIFCRDDEVFVAYRVLRGGYRWAHVKSPLVYGDYIKFSQPRSPFVLEVALAEEYGGDFQAFVEDIADNELREASAGVSYRSCGEARAGPGAEPFSLFLPVRGLPRVEGREVDLNWPLFDSPYLRAAWGSGIIEVSKGSRRLVLDFSNPSAPRKVEK